MQIVDIPATQAARLIPLLHQVHALHVLHQPERYPPLPANDILLPWLTDWLNGACLHCLGAQDAAEDLLGYAIFEIEHRPAMPMRAAQTRAMLHHISVDTQHRGTGIGSALIREIKARLPAYGATVLATTYATFNHASERLMARAGLSPVTVYSELRLT